MTRTSSISRHLIGDDIEVHVSASRILVQDRQDPADDHKDTVQLLSSVEGAVSFRIKPDRRRVDTIVPAEHDRRRI